MNLSSPCKKVNFQARHKRCERMREPFLETSVPPPSARWLQLRWLVVAADFTQSARSWGRRGVGCPSLDADRAEQQQQEPKACCRSAYYRCSLEAR